MSMSRLWRRIAIIRTTLLRDPGGKTRSRRLNRRSLRRPNPWRASKGSGRRNPGRESSRGAVISGSEFRDEGTAQHAADCHERGGLGAARRVGGAGVAGGCRVRERSEEEGERREGGDGFRYHLRCVLVTRKDSPYREHCFTCVEFGE